MHVLAQRPGQTGSGVYFCNLIDRLRAYGHSQRAVYAWQGEDDFAVLEACHCGPVRFNCEELPFPIAGMSDEMPYESTVYGQMDEGMLCAWKTAFTKRLQEERQSFCPDAVILHHLWMLTSLGAEVFKGCITLAVCHNTDLRQAQCCPALKAQHVTKLGGLSAVATLSRRQHPLIRELYGIEEAVMYPLGGGFDERIFYPSPAPLAAQNPEVIFAGKIAPSKGVFELVRAFALAQKEMPCLRLRVVGNASAQNEARFAKLAEGLTGLVRQPALPQRQLAEVFRAGNVFALPSYYEGIALSAVEALACGLWCVTSEIEDLQALLGEGINSSGAIQYLPLPRLYDTDKPFLEDVDAFVQALAGALLAQAEKALQGKALPPQIGPLLAGRSWRGVAGRFNALLQELQKNQ